MMAWKNKPGTGRQGGFTLMELIVSLSILAAIMGLIVVAFRLTGRSLVRGEAEASDMARQRAVEEILERSIRSAEPTAVLTGEAAAPYFLGERGRLRFLSASPPASLSGGGSRLICFSGGRGRDDLGLLVSDASPMRAEGVEEWEGTEKPRVLLPGASEVSFAYTPGPAENGKFEWTEEWDGREKSGLPAAVRVEYSVLHEDGPRKTSFVVTIPAGGS